jgi:hypothetical protein
MFSKSIHHFQYRGIIPRLSFSNQKLDGKSSMNGMFCFRIIDVNGDFAASQVRLPERKECRTWNDF